MRRLLVICCLLMLVTQLTGCWSRKEIDELAVIVAMGFDLEEGSMPYRVTMQIARPSALVRGGGGGGGGGGGSKGPPVEVITAVGRTPLEAARYLQRGMPRRFHPQHNEVFVIGQSLARRGIAPLVDFFERDPLLRPNMLVLVAKDSAREILQRSKDLEATLAETVTGLIRFRTYTSTTMRVEANDLAQVMSQGDRDPVISAVRLNPVPVDQGKPNVFLEDVGILKGDRLVGWLTGEANLGFLWIRNKVARGTLTVPCPGEPGRYLTVDVIRGNSKHRVTLEAGHPVVHVKADLETELMVQECRQDLSTEKGIALVEAEQREHVMRSIMDAVKTAKALKSDVLGFGQHFHQEEPRYWRQVAARWDDEVFPQVEVRVSADVHLRRVGMISKPVNQPDQGKEQ